MNGIITGNIANFAEQIISVIEKHIKYGQFVITVDNVDKKQLTISISSSVVNGIDIYNVVRDGVLYVYFFHLSKKGKKNLDSRDQSQTQDRDKEIVINYKDAVVYNITLSGNGVANISKNLKKHKLEMITQLDELHTLYKFNNKYLFMIDTNGTLFYYPDSIAITSLKSWIESSISNNNQSILDGITLDKYLLLNKFVSLECNLDTTAYGLYDVLKCNEVSSNVAIITSTNIQIQNNQNNQNTQHSEEPQSQSQSDGSNASTNASYSTLGYILSWLNPLAYYNSNSSSNSSSTSSNTSSSTSTNTENKTIDIDNNIDNDNDIDIAIDIPNIDNNNDNNIDKQNTSYFLDTSLQNYDLIKVQDNQVKILKAQKIDIPVFITDITIDKVDNIIISGQIDNQPIIMKYNKYMVGMHVV